MTFKHKVAHRLSLMRSLALIGAAVAFVACADESPVGPSPSDSIAPLAAAATVCQTAASSWSNAGITTQAGTFTLRFDATPAGGAIDGVIGLSAGAAHGYTDLGPIIRFSAGGRLDARNGGAYAAARVIGYSAGVTYHVRLVVDVKAHTYSAYVAAGTGSEQAVGTGYAFRTEQNKASSLANLGAIASAGSVSICNAALGSGTATVATVNVAPTTTTLAAGASKQLTATAQDPSGNPVTGQSVSWTTSNASVARVSSSGVVSALAPGSATVAATVQGKQATATVVVQSTAPAGACVTSGKGWSNTSFAVQRGTFTAEFDATPGSTGVDGVIGLGGAAASSYDHLAAIVRFNTGGTIDARNGGAYAAAKAIGYSAGKPYHFRLVVDLTTHTYSAYVTAPGASEQAIGAGYAFRTQQSGASSLANWAAITSGGTVSICNFLLSGAAAPASVASVTVSPTPVALAVGANRQLTATPKSSSGATVSGQAVSWTSSNAAVANVSSTGLVVGVGAGSATITASAGGVKATAGVTVSTASSSSCRPTGSGVCRYVDASGGSDANPGTSAQPFQSLQRAAQVVNPGDVVVVRDGVYTGGSRIVDITRSGTSSSWIVFQAEHRWGAVIDGRSNSSTTGIEVGGSYIRVEGFEIRGAGRYGIEAYHGHDVVVSQNHIHDIGRYCTDTSGGMVGVNAYAPNVTVERNVIHTIGRYGPGEHGCQPSTLYWQNHDHGVYHGIGNNLVIRSNLFYDHQRGWPIQRYDGSGSVVDGLTIVNNTFVGANPNKVGHIIIATATRNLVVANNIFYQPTTAGIWLSTGGSSGKIANNLTYGASLTSGSTSGLSLAANQVNANPQFANPGAMDFHLRAGSPAVRAGMALSTSFVDLGGLLRTAGTVVDLGAYQY